MVNETLSPSPRRRSRVHAERGFTLVEILVVISIIALVVSLVGPRVLGHLDESKVKAARIQIESLASAIELYFLDTGRYPSTADGLNALVRRPGAVSGWNGPYLRSNAVPLDPWGRPYIYRFPGQLGPYDIVALGADGQEGGTGAAIDVVSGLR